jgi:hypothetical protein
MVESDWEYPPDAWEQVQNCTTSNQAGIDTTNPIFAMEFNDKVVEKTKAGLRFSCFKGSNNDVRWEAYFKSGLNSLSPEEKAGIELYRDEIIEEGDLMAYEPPLKIEEGELVPTYDELLASSLKIADEISAVCETCPFLLGSLLVTLSREFLLTVI